MFDNAFSLPLGFAYLNIGIAGVVIALIACLVSLIVWLARKNVLNALPAAFVVLAMPPMLIGIIPGAEGIAAPMALGAAFLAFLTHFRQIGSEESSSTDKVLAGVIGVALAAIVIAYALGSVSSVAS